MGLSPKESDANSRLLLSELIELWDFQFVSELVGVRRKNTSHLMSGVVSVNTAEAYLGEALS